MANTEGMMVLAAIEDDLLDVIKQKKKVEKLSRDTNKTVVQRRKFASQATALRGLEKELKRTQNAIVKRKVREKLAVTKANINRLNTLTGKLRNADADIKKVAAKIKKTTKAIEKLVDVTKKAAELATLLT